MKLAIDLSGFNITMPPTGVLEINVLDVVREYLVAIDNKIILALNLFFICYFLRNIFLPRALRGVMDLKPLMHRYRMDSFYDLNIWVIDFFITLADVFALGTAVFVYAIAYVQGVVPGWSIRLSFGLILIMFIILVVESVPKIRVYLAAQKPKEKH